jgi:type IV pilus assembly protein PilA
MRKKKNAFTLIELLAVIVILAVILVISIPRILDVIETSKKDSFKSTAQLIADSAEKKYVTNKLNNIDEEITCDNSVKLSKEDYVSCKITFDNEGNAKVNIIGKGKFDGLAVIDGTKMSSEIVELELPEYGLMKTYIENLYNNETLRKANDLKKDNTLDQNIRYYGSNPNNYVSFNNELWRIIGIFGNNVKLVRSESLGKLSWDSSDPSVNYGYGVNQWGESTYEDGSYYEGADLMQYLNKMYYGGTSVTCYKERDHKTTTCPTNKLDNTSKALIDNYTWNLGGVISEQDIVAIYNGERGNVTGKICSSGIICNDTIKRTTTWTGYVALPYVTDWAYASSEKICETNMEAETPSNCKNNNWMYKNKSYWTLSIYPWEEISNNILVIYVGGWNGGQAGRSHQIFPSIYLKSNVIIESGAGTSSDPYMLKLNS